MTVQTNNNSISYVGNGSTTHFDYDYLILNASHLKVYFGDVLQTSGYVVSGVSSQTGGTVAFAVAPPNGTNITLIRDVPFLQLTDYQPYDAFPAESHERALDLLTMMTQQLKDELGRTMQHPVGGNKWDARGNEITNVGTGNSGTSAANVNQVRYLIASEVGNDPSASASARSREALRRSYAEAGYNLVDGSFEAGGTLVNVNDVLLQERTGKGYTGPAGPVAAGTDPIGDANWIPRNDVLLREELSSQIGASMVGYSGVMSVDDRLRITGVSPSDREWNCTALTPDCATQIEEAWLKAQELKTNLVLPKKYKVGRMLDMNCPSYFVGSEIIGNGKWATGIEYTGSADIDGLLDFRTTSGSTITTLGIRNAGFWGNRKTDSLMSSLNGFAFTDLKIDNNLFNGGKVANVDIAAFVATINNNYFRDGGGIGFRLRDKPVGWVGGYQNTTLSMYGNYSLYVANGYDVRDVGYADFYANACDGEGVQVAYTFSSFNGAFRNNGAERIKRYGDFTSCMFSEFSGYASAAGIGATGLTIPNLIRFSGGCDVNWTGFSDLDISTVDATYTDKVRVELGNANMNVKVKTGYVNTRHFGVYGTPAGAAKNPRGVWFEQDTRYSSQEKGGIFLGGVITNEHSAPVNSLATLKNPVSKSSLGFYLGASGKTARLSNFPISSLTKTNAAMFVVHVKGVGKFFAEPWEYIAHCYYVNGGSLAVSTTAIKALTTGVPFTISDSTGFLELTNNGAGTDTLFMVDVEVVAAGGISSASMSYGLSSPYF